MSSRSSRQGTEFIGQVFRDRYRIERQLGRQTGRRTFLAEDLHTYTWVVIKLLSFSPDFEWDDLKLFQREADILKALDHPAIPRYLDSFEVDTTALKGFALVQTYIAAPTLQDEMQRSRGFTEVELRHIAQSLLKILQDLHRRHPAVIHRDIKPSNVLLQAQTDPIPDTVYLVDFGSVQTVLAREGGTLTVVGTYGYMPPEQFGGRAVPASDLYSVGATLIALATGCHPADLPQKDLRIQFESATHFSPAFTQWLRWMTEPSLDRRLQSAQEALKALEQLETRIQLQRSQPAGSRIQVRQTQPNTGEIFIPGPGFHPGLIALGVFAIAWNTFIFFWTFMASHSPFPINLVFIVFSLPFWTAGLSMALMILFSVWGRVRLQIHPQRVGLVYELFGVRYAPQAASLRQDVERIEYVRKQRGFQIDSSSSENKSKLVLWAGVRKYEVAEDLVSEPELEWLGQELSQWLNLPVTGLTTS